MSEKCDCQSGESCSCGGGGCDCGCECCGVGHFERRFQTKAEQIEMLETYLGELKKEVQAVEEHLSDLRK
jgi:hypothetical protein